MCRVMYSTETGSSTVRRWDWHSMRARSMRMRASAVNPAPQHRHQHSSFSLSLVSQFSPPLSLPSPPRVPHPPSRAIAFPILVSSEGALTRKAEANVVVEHGGLANGPGVLELEDTLLLDGEDDAVLAPHSNGTGPLPDGFHRIVDLGETQKVLVKEKGRKGEGCYLEEVSIGTEDCQGAVVTHRGRRGRGKRARGREEGSKWGGWGGCWLVPPVW